MADTPAELAATPAQIDAHKQLVDQAVKAFGSQHYDHYDFLLTISNNLGGNGLEHHRSSEDGVNRGYFTDWENKLRDRNLLPHEYQPQLGRQVPPSSGPVDARLSHADAGQPAVGLRRPDAILGLRARRPVGDALEAGHAGRDRGDGGHLQHRHAGPRLAPAGRHDQRPDHRQPGAGSHGAAGSGARIITARAS